MSHEHPTEMNGDLTGGLVDGTEEVVRGVPADPTPGECADFLERIVYFLDNELDESDCSAVRLHLDSCNPCLEKYDLQRTVKAVVARSCTEAAPDQLRQKVLLQIRRVQVEIREG